MAEDKSAPSEQLLLAEMQVLLAQLRTQLSILRAGMGLFAGALTVYFLFEANHWEIPVINQSPLLTKGVLAMLALLGLWRFLSAERKLVLIHRLIKKAEAYDPRIDEIMV